MVSVLFSFNSHSTVFTIPQPSIGGGVCSSVKFYSKNSSSRFCFYFLLHLLLISFRVLFWVVLCFHERGERKSINDLTINNNYFRNFFFVLILAWRDFVLLSFPESFSIITKSIWCDGSEEEEDDEIHPKCTLCHFYFSSSALGLRVAWKLYEKRILLVLPRNSGRRKKRVFTY